MRLALTLVIVAIIGLWALSVWQKPESPLGAFTDANILSAITTYQQTLQENGRFREYPKTKISEFEYWVNEYLSPLGNGYELVIIRTNKNGTKSVRQFATGPEALQRTFSWEPYIENPLQK